MYIIQDTNTGLYLLNAVCCNMDATYTCVWGEHKRDARVYEDRSEAQFIAARASVTATLQRVQVTVDRGRHPERPTSGRAEGEHTGCAARNPWPAEGEDRGRHT